MANLPDQLPVSIWTFHPMTWLSNQRNKNACDSQLNAKSVVNNIVVPQGKLPSSYHQVEIIEFNRRSEDWKRPNKA